MKSRYEGIQNYIMHADESCFFLTLLSVAEEERKRRSWSAEDIPVDFLDAVRVCMDKGWLWKDFIVYDDCKILSFLTGEDVKKDVLHEVGLVKGNQYTIEKWAWGDRTHFRRRGWDVYKDSQTVKYGYRMCTYRYTFEE